MAKNRYRITIEIDTDQRLDKLSVNKIANDAMDQTVTRNSNPVYLSVENITDQAVMRNLR